MRHRKGCNKETFPWKFKKIEKNSPVWLCNAADLLVNIVVAGLEYKFNPCRVDLL